MVVTRSFGSMIDPAVFADDLARPLLQGLDPPAAVPTNAAAEVPYTLVASTLSTRKGLRRRDGVPQLQLPDHH